MEQAKAAVQAFLSKSHIGEGLVLQGKLIDLKLARFALTATEIQAVIQAKGTAEISLRLQ
jgi:hypothetical protein